MPLPAWVIPAIKAAPAVVGGIASMFSGGGSSGTSDTEVQRNQYNQYLMQKEFAQKGMQWKVADAQAAGLHPLAALGATTHGYAPQQVGGSTEYKPKKNFSRMGQNISSLLIDLFKQKKESELIDSQKRLLDAQAKYYSGQADAVKGTTTPYVPVTGFNRQGPGTVTKQSETTATKSMGTEAATSPLMKHRIDHQGWVWNLLTQDASEPLESDPLQRAKRAFFQGVEWIAGSDKNKRPKVPVPPGKKLIYVRAFNQWRLVNKKPSNKYRGKVPDYRRGYNKLGKSH